MKKIFCLTVFLACSFFSVQTFAQAKPSGWTKHQAKKWFKKKEWLGGLQLQPHRSVDIVELARQYHANTGYWQKAFEFLRTQDLQTITKGKYAIDGDNVYATVQEAATKDRDSTKWESHRKYIDLQYVISGEEKIGVCPVSKATVARSYDEAKDLANYNANGKEYDAVPGSFFLFFPSDAHRPNITPGGRLVDKKIVIKIRYADNAR